MAHGIRTTERFDYFTLSQSRYDTSVSIYGWGTYPRSSVLAGQARKVFLESAVNEAEARAWIAQNHGKRKAADAHWSSKWTEPQVSLAHLPDDGDY